MTGPVLQQSSVVEELSPPPDPERAFVALSELPHCVFFDSVMQHAELGRYSFLAADPFDYLSVPVGRTGSLNRLRRELTKYAATTIGGLPPFQGGAAGLLSYDLRGEFEQVSPLRKNEFQLPALAIGLYDVVLAFDHLDGRAWVISQGFPETTSRARSKRARQRLAWLRNRLETAATTRPTEDLASPVQLSTEHHLVRSRSDLYSNFTRRSYCDAVQRTIDYIHAGDVFQVNLSQRLLSPVTSSSVNLYRRLRACNPATFAGYFDLGPQQIVSASPERFLFLKDRRVEARPIKGTRKRTAKPEADLFAGDELKESEKDRAENVMIVDLMRNDLARVCMPDSIIVTQLCELETYEYVQHLVSSIEGKLLDDCDGLQLLQAAFPGGSITGAPKIRAMEIIAEVEQVARGAYCGSLGYLSFDGTMDWNILIRTITAGGGWWQLPVGGGVVVQSDPAAEYDETWHKAEGMIQALA